MENNKKRQIKAARLLCSLLWAIGDFSKLPMNAKREFL